MFSHYHSHVWIAYNNSLNNCVPIISYLMASGRGGGGVSRGNWGFFLKLLSLRSQGTIDALFISQFFG